MPNPFTRKKRRYRLSAAGRAALRKSILACRPWLCGSGPKTPDGKLAIRNNNLRHGYYAKASLPEAKEFRTFQRGVQRARLQASFDSDPGQPVIEA